MAWIKMRNNLWDDPRVSRLCELCDCSEAPIIGGLYWLWAMADNHTEDGILPGLTLRQIDRKVGVPGFAAAQVSIGWLTEAEAGVRIIRFEEHNGASAKRRATDAQRKASSRGSGPQDGDDIPPDVGDVSASSADKSRKGRGGNAGKLGAREEKSNSGAKAPDASASKRKRPQDEDPVKREIWDTGKRVLMAEGMDAATAGGFLGGMLRDYGQPQVLEVVRSADMADPKPMNLREWMTAACLRATGRRLTPVSGRADRASQFHAGLDAALDDDVPPPGDRHASDDDRTVDTTSRRVD